MMSASPSISAPKMSALAKAALQFQVFILRRNWMGKMGDFVMVITTTGRKSGKTFSTPIGYVYAGEAYVALTTGGAVQSNWYQNVRAHPQATLEIKGQRRAVRVEFLDDPAQRAAALALFRDQRAASFKSFFGVTIDAPAEEIERAVASRVFVRFQPE